MAEREPAPTAEPPMPTAFKDWPATEARLVDGIRRAEEGKPMLTRKQFLKAERLRQTYEQPGLTGSCAPPLAKPEPPAPSPDESVGSRRSGGHEKSTTSGQRAGEFRDEPSGTLVPPAGCGSDLLLPAPAPSPDLDPLEERLRKIEEEHRGVRNGGPLLCPICHHNGGFLHANSPCEVLHMIAALRVLKRGHEEAPWAERVKVAGHWVNACRCGDPWPCPILAEAARALRGESK